MITEYTKGSITINIGFGDENHNPEEYKLKRGLTPYIKYDGVWYKVKQNVILIYCRQPISMTFIKYLTSNNYSEEIFLEKILKLI